MGLGILTGDFHWYRDKVTTPLTPGPICVRGVGPCVISSDLKVVPKPVSDGWFPVSCEGPRLWGPRVVVPVRTVSNSCSHNLFVTDYQYET